MKVYISGPISLNGTLSAEEIEENLSKFDLAVDSLREHGYDVLSPHEIPKKDSWEAYMRVCIAMVLDSDVVFVLPGWGKSRGSVFEVLVAQTVGTPVEEFSRVSSEIANET